jgi:hypothetical protein
MAIQAVSSHYSKPGSDRFDAHVRTICNACATVGFYAIFGHLSIVALVNDGVLNPQLTFL